MQFGATVDCFGLQFCGKLGVGIFQTVDGPIDVFLQTPGATEINDFDAPVDCLRNPLARVFVRRCQKQYLNAGVNDPFPAERQDFVGLMISWRCELRVKVFEICGQSYLCLAGTAEECWRSSIQSRMAQQQTREFAAGVAADACYGDAGCSCRGVAAPGIGSINRVNYC
jgi:hypothetical protein